MRLVVESDASADGKLFQTTGAVGRKTRLAKIR
jgi:hypothetical protein